MYTCAVCPVWNIWCSLSWVVLLLGYRWTILTLTEIWMRFSIESKDSSNKPGPFNNPTTDNPTKPNTPPETCAFPNRHVTALPKALVLVAQENTHLVTTSGRPSMRSSISVNLKISPTWNIPAIFAGECYEIIHIFLKKIKVDITQSSTCKNTHKIYEAGFEHL